MRVLISGRALRLHPAGIAILDDSRTAVVSDLHLEKGSHFAQRGFFLPPYDTAETLLRLLDTLAAEDISRLIILGDCFHDPKGYQRLDEKSRAIFTSLLSFSPIWIKGNHDGDFVPPGFDAYDELELEGLLFRHERQPHAAGEVSGHYHPKGDLVHKGARIMRPCFVEDGEGLILPAFGAYTGGLAVSSPVIRNLFRGPFRIHLLGREKLYSFDAA